MVLVYNKLSIRQEGFLMTQLYLVRHGQTEWSQSGRHTSVTDVDLTDVGRHQAESLRARLTPEDFGLILTSPRRRARTTAALAGFPNAEVDEDLAEWYYGDFEGKTMAEIHQTTPDWRVWTGPAPGGESSAEVEARLFRVVDRVRESGVEKAICFSHGHALRVLALCWIGIGIEHGGSFPVPTASVSILGYDAGVPAILTWNQTSYCDIQVVS